MKEIRVYAVSCDNYDGDKDLTTISNEEFMSIAESQGNVWSLMGFQLNWNHWECYCPDATSSYLRFIEVECSESINFEEWEIPFVKLNV